MVSQLLSPVEEHYLVGAVAANVRLDGRRRLDYRRMVLESSVVSQASGSARCKIDGTDVLVGVKMEIGEPDALLPAQGMVRVAVECAPSASRDFEGKGADDLNVELAQMLQRFLTKSNAIDCNDLNIVAGKQCWIAYVDALVLDYDGNVADAISIAARAALRDTRIPAVTVVEAGVGAFELEVSDDPADHKRIDVSRVPVCVTLFKIGDHYVVDATPAEEYCADVKVTLAVNSSGSICGVQKGDGGGIDPSLLFDMIQTGKKVGLTMLQRMDNLLNDEEKRVEEADPMADEPIKVGFFA